MQNQFVKQQVSLGLFLRGFLVSIEGLIVITKLLVHTYFYDLLPTHLLLWGTAVARWLSCCAINRKVVGSIPDGDIGIFH